MCVTSQQQQKKGVTTLSKFGFVNEWMNEWISSKSLKYQQWDRNTYMTRNFWIQDDSIKTINLKHSGTLLFTIISWHFLNEGERGKADNEIKSEGAAAKTCWDHTDYITQLIQHVGTLKKKEVIPKFRNHWIIMNHPIENVYYKFRPTEILLKCQWLLCLPQ